ncbi:short chain dehydrogenase reductase [Xylariaceae sp. FL0594]|nr:short chain dehydrogenase reductase [Xylariaceae sp. FL0594]
MAALHITKDMMPYLVGKRCVITGGSSGIGLATARLLRSLAAEVTILDVVEPPADMMEEALDDIIGVLRPVKFHHCDVTDWEELHDCFNGDDCIHMDYVFANAGVLEDNHPYFAEVCDEAGSLKEPDYSMMDVNVKGVYNTVKLAWHYMKRMNQLDRETGIISSHELPEKSIVITTSSTAYFPEPGLPIYSSGKAALVGLIRALRTVTIRDNITINGVAPAPTDTIMLPGKLASAFASHDVPLSTPEHVALALVYSATARQDRKVETYGKEPREDVFKKGERWNGRVIMAFGDRFAELEEPIADLKPFWLGSENDRWLRDQQAATDFREEFQWNTKKDRKKDPIFG